MAKHDRKMINAHSIPEFAKFAESVGAKVRPGKGAFQLLQIKTVGTEWHAICKNAEGVVSTPSELRTLIKQFKDQPMPAAIAAPAPASKQGQYVADLRDDAAIRMMTALLVKCSDPTALLPQHIDSTAVLAYRMADALMVAGGHA